MVQVWSQNIAGVPPHYSGLEEMKIATFRFDIAKGKRYARKARLDVVRSSRENGQ